MAMEGALSKWTNVMNGWQYRYFVLDENSGLLSYYTSRDRMRRGARRGCVRLRGAVVGIDDEDDSTFTITVDQKTFHFQATNLEEREQWVAALERTILRHINGGRLQTPLARSQATIEEYDRRLMETDAYLQLLIDQIESLEHRIEQCQELATKEKYSVIHQLGKAMIESIKHTIVMLQISKESLKEPVMNGSMHYPPLLTNEADFDHYSTLGKNEALAVPHSISSHLLDAGVSAPPMAVHRDLASIPVSSSLPILSVCSVPTPEAEDLASGDGYHLTAPVPETSYSSSEDEEFFDAEEQKSGKASPEKQAKNKANSTEILEDTNVDETVISPPVIAAEDDYFDELYDEKDKEALGSLEQHGSIISHLLSQVRIGMDLTKVVLPTFILERRSLLEFYGDFFAHPDLFVRIADMETPKDRMVQLLRWYLSAFHAGRQSEIAKKPYNPILGETFRCHWSIPDSPTNEPQVLVEDGPLPWATPHNLTFIAEQVSHHPPISAFYAEHFNKRISLDGYIWTKSKFLGLSIGVHMIGKAVVSVIDHDEEYTLTFPNGYGRSILTTPWIEMGGNIQLACAKTGYSATVEFHTKPFYGGKKHRVTASAFEPNEKKPFMTVEGEWNGIMYAKHATGRSEVFVDTTRLPIMKKKVKPRDQQTEFESRRLWSEVTRNLKNKNVELATEFKHALEQRQREEAKERKEKGLSWETRYFHEVGEHWVFDRSLLKRLSRLRSSPKSSSPSTPRTARSLTAEPGSSPQRDPSPSIPSTSVEAD